MVKKSNIKIPTIAVIRLIVFLFIGIVLFWAYSSTVDFISKSDMFDVKTVLVDQSISFIDSQFLVGLKGQNIFSVDLNRIHKRISSQYPQISQLRIMKQLPDTIKVLAKKRDILLQIPMNNKFLIVDTEGVTMFYTATALPFPIVRGIPLQRIKIVLGQGSSSKELNLVVDLLGLLKSHPHTSRLKVVSIEAGNLSKIELTVLPNIKIIIDQEDLAQKVDILEILLQNTKINWAHVKYMDIRFKEPIINESVPTEEK